MKKYIVSVTNGFTNKELEIKVDGEWVTDKESAAKMAESKINNSWKVVRVD